MRLSTLCCGLAVLLAPIAAAQDVTVERDGDEVTVTRPDGTVERFTIDEDAELRVRSKSGPLVIEDEGGETRRHFEFREDGPRAFAFRVPPGAPPFHFEDFDFDVEIDSTLDRALGFRFGPDGFDGERFLPWPDFGRRGGDPATRREIAEGERESRRLARQVRRADGAERERLTQELRETLERTFDLKQQVRREQAEALGEDAERLREELAQVEEELRERAAARDEIIERRQQELLGEGDTLDW